MNKVLLVGRIANEIKLITTQNGVNLIKSAIAVRIPNSSSNDAEFIEVIASGTIADFISKNVAKGTLVSLEGNLTSYKFRNKTGSLLKITYVNIQEINVLQKAISYNKQSTEYDNSKKNTIEDIPTAELIIED